MLTIIYEDVRSLKDLNANLLKEIERFFISYNETRGKKFNVLGRHGPKRALALLVQSKKQAGE
jgi:inorganic pyrophosphatase